MKTLRAIPGALFFSCAALAAGCIAGSSDTSAEEEAARNSPLNAGSCAHPLCSEGDKLGSSCDPCVQKICQKDPFCCGTNWDTQCVGEVASICSRSCAGGSSSSSSSSSGAGGGSFDQAAQACVDKINQYRATLGLPAYQRWTQDEACAGQQAQKDGQSGAPHSGIGMCGEWAQNECPGWPGPPASMIGSCLEMMWAEGPGDVFGGHGHYVNMSSTKYTKVACGFYVLPNGKVWATQDFH
jgi:hypothetical protein